MSKGNGKVNLPSQVEWVVVADLVIGARYQRTIKQSVVKNIAENFDPFQFGVPAAVRREDGSLHVTDGQHRIMALRRMGWDDQRIQVEVTGGLEYYTEAGMHVDRNANRRATSNYDKYIGNLEANRPVQVAIDRITKDRGLTISKKAGDGAVFAVATLERLYEDGGTVLVERTLDIILEAWGTTSDGFQSEILKAIAKLQQEYDRLLDGDRLVRSLKRYRPAEYVKRGYAGRELNRSNTVNNILVAVVADYNQLPGGRKLPPANDLIGRGYRGGTRRLTTAQREQVKELVRQGYANREIKDRFPMITTKYLGNIRTEIGVKRPKTKRPLKKLVPKS